MAGDHLVKLHLVAPMSVEPTPDKSVFGRFDRVLRSVGAPREVMVRPRMITAVAETKYKTGDGLPVSVVGLHGKDELLVVGPVWALEDLANGRSTSDLKEVRSSLDVLIDVRQYVLEEIFWLARLPELLARASSGEPKAPPSDALKGLRESGGGILFLRDPEWEAMAREFASSAPVDMDIAVELLQGMFRAHKDVVFSYFRDVDANEFASAYLIEAAAHYERIASKIAEGSDPHPAWWLAWDKDGRTQDAEAHPYFLLPEGRNISAYPISSESNLMLPKPRRYSMHRRWRTVMRAHLEKALPGQNESWTREAAPE